MPCFVDRDGGHVSAVSVIPVVRLLTEYHRIDPGFAIVLRISKQDAARPRSFWLPCWSIRLELTILRDGVNAIAVLRSRCFYSQLGHKSKGASEHQSLVVVIRTNKWAFAQRLPAVIGH